MPTSIPNSHVFPPTLTPQQWTTLYALTSAVIHPLADPDLTTHLSSAPNDSSKAHIKAFLLSSADQTNQPFRHALERHLEEQVAKQDVQGMAFILSFLDSLLGRLILTFSTTPFYLRPTSVRESLVRSWLDPSSLVLFPPIRGFTRAIAGLTKVAWSRSADPQLFYGAVGYHEKTGVGVRGDARGDEAAFYEFEFMEFEVGGREEAMEVGCDVVIVGSGCGGAVAAARIAKEGFDVVLVERGNWVPPDQLPLPEVEAFNKLFYRGMAASSADGSVAIAAGETFGGGGVVNWAASLQTQGFVREEWANEHNLPFFLSGDYQSCLDAVCERMGVTTNVAHNHRNQTLLEGCRKLGYSCITVPQNTGAKVEGDDQDGEERLHSDGYCAYGCGSGKKGQGRKMGTTQTWLPDAARAGARFIQTYHMEKVLFADPTNTRATGIIGTWGSQSTPLKITAKKVIISAGGLHSPCILLRSGLTNPTIGKFLHLHPAIPIHAFFPTPTNPWLGSPITAACTSFENLDGNHHGSKLETSTMGPLFTIASIPWHSSSSFKSSLMRYRHSGLFSAIHRERHPGSVHVDVATGEPAVQYTLSGADEKMMRTALVGLAKVLYVQGAEEIVPALNGLASFKRWPTESEREEEVREERAEAELRGVFSQGLEQGGEYGDCGIADRRFQRWLVKLGDYGLRRDSTVTASAHQMSSCRMGNDGGVSSVVDPRGRVWGVDGLLVADASVMPSACGVNPMITTMAIAHWIAGGVVEDLKK